MWIRTFVLVGLLASNNVLAGDIASRFDGFMEIEREAFKRPELEQPAFVRRAFDQYFAGVFSEGALAKASGPELALLLQAADTMGFYSNAREDLSMLSRVLHQLERRNLASDTDRALYFRALVGQRMFDEARAYRARHPAMDVEAIPVIEGARDRSPGPFVLATNHDAPGLSLRRVRIDTGVQLVVVSHPLCAFSREAMQTLSQDPILADLLRSRTTWVAPVSRRLYVDAMHAWNRDNPATQIVLADRREDWPFIRIWATPTFYLLKDGQLVGSFEGWPKGVGRRLQLVTLLRAAGIPVE